MPLPTLNMSASLTATPALPLPFDSSTGDLAFGPISAELGTVAFKSIGDNVYEAKLPASLVRAHELPRWRALQLQAFTKSPQRCLWQRMIPTQNTLSLPFQRSLTSSVLPLLTLQG